MVDKAILIRYSVIQNIIITVFRLDFITCLLFIRLHSLSFYLQFISALQRLDKCCLSCHVVIVRLIQFKEKAYSCSFYPTAVLSQFFGELKKLRCMLCLNNNTNNNKRTPSQPCLLFILLNAGSTIVSVIYSVLLYSFMFMEPYLRFSMFRMSSLTLCCFP